MFCSQCGQTIPDASRFCMFCGTALGVVITSPTASRRAGPSSTAEPAAIRSAGIWLQGATEMQKRGVLRYVYIGRGFGFWVTLNDDQERMTSGPGTLSIALLPSYWDQVRGEVGGNELRESTAKAARREQKDAVWFKEFKLQAADFTWQQIPDGDDREYLAFTYRQNDPLLYVYTPEASRGSNVYLHAWYVLPTGRCLYKRGYYVNWK